MTVGQTAEAMPTGIPTSVERMIATAIRASVVIALGHICDVPSGPPFGICSTPNDATISAENSAVRHEPTSQAISVATSSTPSQVIQWKSSTIQFVVSFRKLPKPADDVVQEEVRALVVGDPAVEAVEPARDAEHPVGREAAVHAGRDRGDDAERDRHGGGQAPAGEAAEARVEAAGGCAERGRRRRSSRRRWHLA